MRPLGSVYHYFPGGKEQIGVEALVRSGERIRQTIARAGDTPRPARPRSTSTSCTTPSGCATPTTSAAARSRRWRSRPPATSSPSARRARTCSRVGRPRFAEVLRDAGIAEADAEPLATFVLSSYEGALTMSRALRDIQPMLTQPAPRWHPCCTRTSATHPTPGSAPHVHVARETPVSCSKRGCGRRSASRR